MIGIKAQRGFRAFFSLLLAGALSLQAAPIVREIEVRHEGVGKSDPEFVIAHTRVQVGEELSSPAVSRDVKILLETGQFSTVDADIEAEADGVKLIFTVQPKMRLAADPKLVGATVFWRSKVRKLLVLSEGDLVDDQSVGVAVQEVLKAYREKSYADATASWEFESVDESAGVVRLTITFDERDVGYIAKSRLQGNDSISAGELRKALKRPSPFNPIRWIWKKRYERYELDEIEANVSKVYMDQGYLDVTVAVGVADQTGSERDIANVKIEEGAQYHLSSIAVEGITLFPEHELMPLVDLNSGDVASLGRINAVASRLQTFYGDRGYLHSDVRPSLKPTAETATVGLTFIVTEGELVHIRNIIVRGNTRTKDKVIRRELQVYPGEVYNQSRVKRSERRINNLGFFETVRVLPQTTEDRDERDIVFEVTEKRTGQFMLGAGYSSVDNVIGFVELSQGNFDLMGWPNFTGGGQKLRMRAQFGSRRKDYELSLTEPWFMNRRLSLGFDVYRRDRNFTDYDVERTGASVSLGKALPGPNRINLRYNIEQSVITDITDTNTYYELDSYNFENGTGQPYLFESEQDRVKSTLTATLVHDTRNNPFVPSRGSKVSLFYSISGGPMGFDTDIYDVGFKSTTYIPLWFGHVFNLRTRFEFVEAFGNTEAVPLADRLFLGGGRTLRGFNYRDVGPKVIRPIDGVDGFYDRSFGGQSLFMANAEYTIPIIKGVRFGAFYDTGNVWSGSYQVEFNDLASSAGCGLRLDMPGFPIRIDRAWALEFDDEFSQEDRWVIWIGYDY